MYRYIFIIVTRPQVVFYNMSVIKLSLHKVTKLKQFLKRSLLLTTHWILRLKLEFSNCVIAWRNWKPHCCLVILTIDWMVIDCDQPVQELFTGNQLNPVLKKARPNVNQLSYWSLTNLSRSQREHNESFTKRGRYLTRILMHAWPT